MTKKYSRCENFEIFFLENPKIAQDNFLILSQGPIELQEKTIRWFRFLQIFTIFEFSRPNFLETSKSISKSHKTSQIQGPKIEIFTKTLLKQLIHLRNHSLNNRKQNKYIQIVMIINTKLFYVAEFRGIKLIQVHSGHKNTKKETHF